MGGAFKELITREAVKAGDMSVDDYNEVNGFSSSIRTTKKQNKKSEKLPKVNPNIKCMQATIEWKYFDNRIELQSIIDTLIEEGYTIDAVIPKTQYLKAGGTTILLTEAIIIVSK